MINKEIKDVTLPDSIYNFVTLAVTNSFDSTLFDTFKGLKKTVEQKANQVLDTTTHNNYSSHNNSNQHNNNHNNVNTHVNFEPFHSNTLKSSTYHINTGGVHTESGGGHSNSGGGHSNYWNSKRTRHTDAGLPHTDAGLKHTDLKTAHSNGTGHSQTGRTVVVPYAQTVNHTDSLQYTQNAHVNQSPHSNGGFDHQNYIPSVSYIYNGKTNTELGNNAVLNKTVTIGMFAYDKNNDNAGSQDTVSKTVKYNLQIRKQGATSWSSLVTASTAETYDLDTTKYTDGIYELMAWAINDSNYYKSYIGQVKQITVEIRQNTLPTLSINNAGQIINFTFSAEVGKNKIPLTGTMYDADDGDLDTIYYRIDGTEGQPGKKYGNTLTSENTNQTFPGDGSAIDVTDVSEGSHTLSVWAQDNSGGKSSESTVTFKVDKTTPVTNAPLLTAKSANEILISSNSSDPVSNGVNSGLGDTSFMFNRNNVDFDGWNSDNYLDQNLSPDTMYAYKYKVTDNASNCSDYSKSSSIYTLAAVPNIYAVNPTSYSLDILTSNDISLDKNPAYTKYQISCTDTLTGTSRYVSSSGELLPVGTSSTDPLTWITLTSVSGTKKIIHVIGLEPEKSYTFKAMVRNSDDVITQESSNSVTNQTLVAPPSTPTGLKVDSETDSYVTANSIKLTWNDVAEATEYEIAVDGDVSSKTVTSNSCIIDGLLPGTKHTFKVRSVNGGNPSSSAWSQSITKYTLPDAPKNIKVQRASDSFTISWDKVISIDSNNATGYDLFLDDGLHHIDNREETSYKIQGLSPNTAYTYKIRANNISGNGEFSEKLIIYTLANNPIEYKVTKITNTSISAQWKGNGNPDSTQYKLAAFNKDGNIIKQNTWTDNLNDTITGLEPERTFSLKIKTRNGDGAETEWVEIESGTKTLPNVPSIPFVQTEAVSTKSIKISWNGIEGQVYNIKRNGILIAENVTTLSIIDSDLAEDTTYKYSVEAKNAGGVSGYSSEISQTTLPNVPDVPTGINSIADTKSITIKWNPVEKATGYKISNGITQIDVGNVTSYTINNLETGKEYSFKIIAYNRGGDGNGSGTYSVYTCIDSPTEVTASATHSSILVSWTSVPESDHYEVYFNGEIYTTASTAMVFDSLEPAVSYKYKVKAVNKTTQSNWSQERSKATLPEKPVVPYGITALSTKTTTFLTWNAVPGATSYDIMIDSQLILGNASTSYTATGLVPGSSHTYMIRARNSGGKSEWSNVLTEYTQASQPNVPSNIVYECSADSITISWGTVIDAEGYEIEIDGVSQPVEGNSYVQTGLISGESHTYRIRSISQGIESDWTDSFTFGTKTSNLGTPSNLKGIPNRQDIALKWDEVEGATGYDLEVNGLIVDMGLNTSYSAQELEADTNYRFRVRMRNEGEKGEWSESINVLTLPETVNIPENFMGKANETAIVLAWKPLEHAFSYDIEFDGSKIENVIGTTFKCGGLLPDSQHTYRIRGINGNQVGEWSEVLNIKTLSDIPLTPENIKAFSSKSSITIDWKGVQTATSYEIEIDGTTVKELADSEYVDNGLKPNEQHSYKIRTKNGINYSEWSDAVSIFTLPEKPETPDGLLVTVKDSKIIAKYSSAEGASGYDIQIDGKTIENGNLLVFEKDDLPGTQHNIRVRAKNPGGVSDWSKEVSILLPEKTPGVPQGITSKPHSDSIEISWSTMESAVSYDIEVYGKVICLGANNKYNDTGLVPGSSHTYRIRANNEGGAGEWSSVITESTELEVPQAINTDSSSGEMVIYWNPIEGIEEYELEIGDKVVSVHGTKYIQKDAVPNRIYSYRVRSKNNVTESAWSKSADGQLPMNVYIGEFFSGDEVPFELAAKNITNINQKKITLIYDPEQVELLDLYSLTEKIDLKLGYIEDTNIKILELSLGRIVLILDDKDLMGEYSGILTTIMFKSKIDGQISISYSMN